MSRLVEDWEKTENTSWNLYASGDKKPGATTVTLKLPDLGANWASLVTSQHPSACRWAAECMSTKAEGKVHVSSKH